MTLEPAILLDSAVLIFALLVILGSSELFTNGIEWLGQKLQLSEGVVGSVLAAVGTALPETLIPIVAVAFFHSEKAEDVGIGAIAGAPFMLSTLTLGLCGWSIQYFAKRGLRPSSLAINTVIISRDLKFFIFAYSIALASGIFRSLPYIRWVLAAGLLVTYSIYLNKTFKHEGEVGTPPEHLHFERLLKAGTGLRAVLCQVCLGLAGILGAAYFFVEHVQTLARNTHVPEVILSLLIAPIATELPEKVNSILWARNNKDTLALGNITGALVFQSCFPVAFGMAFTSWNLGIGTLTTGVIAVACAIGYLQFIERGLLTPKHLMTGIILYSVIVLWLMLSHLVD